MSTRGEYTIIPGRGQAGDGCYFSAYSYRDMYPEGHLARLLDEAADIAERNGWGRIAEKWATKEWLDVVERTRPEVNNRVAALVDAASAGPEYKAGHFWSGCLSPSTVLNDTPSWEGVADMPVAQKHKAFTLDSHFSMVADLANEEMVVFDNAKGADPVPVAVIPMEADALRDVAAQFHRMNGPEDWLRMRPAAPPKRDWQFIHRSLRINDYYTDDWVEVAVPDGQWKRPEGFPKMEDDPSAGTANSAVSSLPTSLPPITVGPASASGSASQSARCNHVGPVSKKQCIRPPHKDRNHRYQ